MELALLPWELEYPKWHLLRKSWQLLPIGLSNEQEVITEIVSPLIWLDNQIAPISGNVLCQLAFNAHTSCPQVGEIVQCEIIQRLAEGCLGKVGPFHFFLLNIPEKTNRCDVKILHVRYERNTFQGIAEGSSSAESDNLTNASNQSQIPRILLEQK